MTLVRKLLTAERVPESVLEWSRIPRYKPAIRDAFVDDEGNLWIDRTSGERGAALDVHSPSGERVATLRTEHRMNTRVHPVIRGTTMWFLAKDDDDVPFVVRGRVVKR